MAYYTSRPIDGPTGVWLLGERAAVSLSVGGRRYFFPHLVLCTTADGFMLFRPRFILLLSLQLYVIILLLCLCVWCIRVCVLYACVCILVCLIV